MNFEQSLDRVASEFASWELSHRQMHDRDGIGRFAVAEQQTGHVVCSWCGWCPDPTHRKGER